MAEHDGSHHVELRPHEERQVADRVRPRAAVLHEAIRVEGELELHRPASSLAWSGLAAGLSMTFSLVAMGLLHAALPDAPWRKLVDSAGYVVGFLIVIIGRQQLFTENTLTPVLPALGNRDVRTFGRVLRLWGVVLLANVVGAAIGAWAVARAGVFHADVQAAFGAVAREAIDGSGVVHLTRGVFSGWLIALLVWMLPGVESSRVLVIAILTYLIGLGGFSHVVAGSVEVAYAVVTGVTTLGDAIARFFLPTLAGNVIGGVALVAALNHAQSVADACPAPSRDEPNHREAERLASGPTNEPA